MLKNFSTVDFTTLTAPVQKLVDLNVARFESAVASQTTATKELVELTESRAKAATEIKDYDGFVAFMKEQAELAKSNTEKLIESSKAAVEQSKSYSVEVQTILTESIEAAKKLAA